MSTSPESEPPNQESENENPDPDGPDDLDDFARQLERDYPEVLRRVGSLLTRYPWTTRLFDMFLEHLDAMQPDVQTVEEVAKLYEFCRAHPDMALLLSSLATIERE